VRGIRGRIVIRPMAQKAVGPLIEEMIEEVVLWGLDSFR
jgi:hypothetical protein